MGEALAAAKKLREEEAVDNRMLREEEAVDNRMLRWREKGWSYARLARKYGLNRKEVKARLAAAMLRKGHVPSS